MKYRDQTFDCEVYESELRKLKRGIPIYYPSPTSIARNYHVHVGDVGYLNNGAFLSVFNAFANTEETRAHNEKRGTPEGFVPVPEELTETVITEVTAPAGTVFMLEDLAPETIAAASEQGMGRSIVEDTSISSKQWLDRIRNIPRRLGGESSASSDTKERVAILTIQDSATRISSLHTQKLKQYVLDNYASWYKDMRDKRGYGVHLQDLMFITECELTGKWSTRVWSRETTHKNSSSRLRLGPLGCLFNRSEESRTTWYFPDRRGPKRNASEMSNKNQCIFLKCFWVKDRSIDRDSDNRYASVVIAMWPKPEPRSSGEYPHEFALNMILNNSKANVAIVHESDVLAIAEAVNFQFGKRPSLRRLRYKGEAIKVVTERDPQSGKLVGTLFHKDSEGYPSDEVTSSEPVDQNENVQHHSSEGRSVFLNSLQLWQEKK